VLILLFLNLRTIDQVAFCAIRWPHLAPGIPEGIVTCETLIPVRSPIHFTVMKTNACIGYSYTYSWIVVNGKVYVDDIVI
jgi:hypothetical protein